MLKCINIVLGVILIEILFSGCNDRFKYSVRSGLVFYFEDIHKNNDIFKADSLLFYGRDTMAFRLFQKLKVISDISDKEKAYIKARLLNMSLTDRDQAKEFYNQLIAVEPSTLHAGTIIEISKYELDNKQVISNPEALKNLISDFNSVDYLNGQVAYILGRYYEERKNNLDSAWYYMMLSHDAFEKTHFITSAYQDCLEKITAFCTYKRKNLLAIQYANAMFDFDRYFPKADSLDKARAYANRAFMMFREGDFDGTVQDIECGLKLIHPEQHPEHYQSLMKSYLVVYMIQGQDDLWQKTASLIAENIQKTGKDHIEMNRWYGQYYTQSNQYQKAIPFLKKALNKEIENGRIHSARFSTLCFLLSQCYENCYNFNKALEYMAINSSLQKYDIQQMLKHVEQSEGYSFVSGLRCANIYFAEYNYTKNLSALKKAKQLLDVLDKVMFRQFKVGEENAILQFYLESGRDYFHLGLDVHYELWKKTGQKSHLESFINYSDKSKNSLMYRDIRMAQRQTVLSEEIINMEFKLRVAIKEEKRKGLRDNRNFDTLIDEYTALEKEIEQKHTPFITEGLIKDELKTVHLKEELPDDSTCILVLDETRDHWYYTLITRQGIIIEKENTSANLSQRSDTLLSLFQKTKGQAELTDNPMVSNLLPKNIRSILTKRILYIPDGIYHRFPLDPILGDGRYAIIHLPTIRLMHKFSDDVSDKKEVALFAFSDVETIKSKNRTNLTELPGTYKEVMALAKKYPKAKIYTGKNATKASFIKTYQDTNIQYIHLALHGLANSAEKDDVKLYFRTTSGGLDSLYGYELMKYKSHCKKVVLSACKSGIGTYIHGEGNYSLPRYFMINGATDVVFNYWDVED